MAKGSKKQPDRDDRLKAQLRANLARRKQQARARRDGAGDERAQGIGVVSDDKSADKSED
ncbi:MAG: hypothetical protein AAF940_08745 [Pseudomonadota bacterium]